MTVLRTVRGLDWNAGDDVGANAKTMGWLSQLRKNVMWGGWDSQVLGVTVKLCLSAKLSFTYSALWCGVGFASWLC